MIDRVNRCNGRIFQIFFFEEREKKEKKEEEEEERESEKVSEEKKKKKSSFVAVFCVTMYVRTFSVSRTFAKEILLLIICSIITSISIVMMVLSMSSKHWLTVRPSKSPVQGMPYLVFELGLTGGIATLYQEFWDHVSHSSIAFEYRNTDKYCPNNECHALFVGGIVASVFLSLSVAASFVTLLMTIVNMLQLSHLWAEKGPFGPYVNYTRCWKNCIYTSIFSMLGTAFAVVAISAWSGIMFRSTEDNIPDMPGGIKWNFGWVWILLLLIPLLMGISSFLHLKVVNAQHPGLTGYTSI